MSPTKSPALNATAHRDRANQNIKSLEVQIEKAQNQLSQLISQLREHPDFQPGNMNKAQMSNEEVIETAEAMKEAYILQLSSYNQIKDVGMHLVGVIADQEGKTTKAVLRERGIQDEE